MLPPNDKFRGCETLLPDTVLFRNGKPFLLVKLDETFCLSALRATESGKSKLNRDYVFRELCRDVRERKNDKNGVYTQLFRKQL